MKTKLILAPLALVLCSSAFAAEKTYQVTGPVVSVTDNSIVVQKGKENWEVARSADTKITGDIKVGSKVTIEYKMTATSVEVKPEAGKKDAKPAEKPAADPTKKAA
ncbi:MAG: hypothetical protein QM680_08235 [Luteolibacter sp.]